MARSARVRINDRMPMFRRSLYTKMDDALREGAKDALIKAKSNAPLDKGQLRSASEIKKQSQATYRVSFWEEYARFQEFGGDSKRRVRNYSTPGTGAHYLERAGDEQAAKLILKFHKHARRAF